MVYFSEIKTILVHDFIKTAKYIFITILLNYEFCVCARARVYVCIQNDIAIVCVRFDMLQNEFIIKMYLKIHEQ